MKLIITSDIHLDCYKKYNISPGYRDNQFLKFADRLIEEAQLQDTKILCILGDLIDKPVNPPEVIQLFNKFIDKLTSHFDKVYYILGNHDCNKKNNDGLSEATYVSLFNNNKFMYMNEKYLTLNEKSIYFQDFQFTNKIIPPECDVFLSHITIDDRFGQEVDSSKFKIGIFGDIHLPIDKDNIHTISSPLQRGFQDYPIGYFGVLDLDILTYTRITTDSERHKFLKIRRETDDDLDKLDKDNLIIIKDNIIKNNKTLEFNNKEYLLEKINNSKILDIIDNSVSDKYKQIHKDIKSKISLTKDDDDINLDFKIKSINIKNFRSIENIEYNFDGEKNTYFISGHNGAGKSSFIRALYLSLYSDKELKSNKKVGCNDSVSTTINFIYNETDYKIYRTEGKLQVFENDIDISPSGKNNVENYLYDLFPFMNLLNIFYIKAGEGFFNRIDSIDVFNKVFNVSFLSKFSDLSNDLYKIEYSKLTELKNDHQKQLGILESIDNELTQYNNELLEYDNLEIIPDIDDKIEELNNYIITYNRATEELNKLTLYLLNNKDIKISDIDIDKLTNDLQELNKSCNNAEQQKLIIKNEYNKLNELSKEKLTLESWILSNKTRDIMSDDDYKKLLLDKDNIENELSKHNTKLNELNNEFMLFNNLNKELKILESELIECPKCLNKFSNKDDKIESIKNDISKLCYDKNLIDTLRDSLIPDLQAKLNIITNNITQYNINIKLISEFNVKKNRVDELLHMLKDVDITGLSNKINEYELLIKNIKNNILLKNNQIKDYNHNSTLLSEIKLNNDKKDTLNIWFNENKKPDKEYLITLKDLSQKYIKQGVLLHNKNNLINKLANETLKINQIKVALVNLEDYIILISEYKALFDFNIEGSIPQKIFEYLSNNLSDEKIKFSTYYYRNKLQIECSINVDEQWIPYESASEGQKSLIDMLLILKINNLLGNIGLLILDETLSHLDNDNYDEVIGIIKELNFNDIFITSHLDKFNLYTKKIEFELKNNNTTIKE